MEFKRLLLALFLAFAAFHLWLLIASRIWPSPQEATTTQPAGRQRVVDSSSRPSIEPGTQPPTGSGPKTIVGAGQAIITPGDKSDPVILGHAEDGSQYPMALEIMPKGATVSKASVRDYHESVTNKVPYPILEPVVVPSGYGKEDQYYSFATQQIRFENHKLSAVLELDQDNWTNAEHTDHRSVWFVDISTRDDKKLLARITKTYELKSQPLEAMTRDLGISIKIENRSEGPLKAILTQLGPVGFRLEDPRGRGYHNVMGGAWEDGEFQTTKCDRAKAVNFPLAADTNNSKVAWAAQGNKYFTCIMAYAERTGPEDVVRFNSVEALRLTDREKDTDLKRKDLTFRYVTKPIEIGAGSSEQISFDCYIGPKSKAVFEEVPHYSQRNYYAVISENYIWCAPEALVGVMMGLLKVFYKIPPHNYGIAIFILVLVVKGILHPITKKSQVNMMKMQKNQARLQPKIHAAKEKYANDRVKMNQALMEIQREEGINPAGTILSCLPMFLQFPIWISLWTALATTIEMRHEGFLWWINDLSAPDALFSFGTPITIPLLSMIMGGAIDSLNILPVLLAVSQLLQARYMPRGNPGAQPQKNPDQLEQQRKMMQFMSLFFMFILYNAPSGLCLYILSSNLFGILEQWQIRKHIEEEEKKHEDKIATAPKKPRKKSWLYKKWESLLKEAEEARKVQSPRQKDKDKGKGKGKGKG
ncbi:MAG: YidC/Oxa1 family insertase periplasmic-domain containing protein, partial [Planctomycetota bacterium]